MEQNQIANQPNIALPQVSFAGFWRRLLAFIIDTIILSIVYGLINSLISSEGSNNILSLLIGWLYFSLLESSVKQATLGKMILRLEVTDEAGKRINFARATGRYFSKILSSIILFIGFLMIGWTKKKQGLHDMIAKTLVIRK